MKDAKRVAEYQRARDSRPDLASEPTDAIEREIARLQEIQKRNHPRSAAWQEAGDALTPLFAEMQMRTHGEISGDAVR